MRYLIIGAVAAGTTAAMKIRRNDDKADIVIYEKGKDISYSGCSLTYYISNIIKDRKSIVPRDNEYFSKYGIEVKTLHQVLEIKPNQKKLRIKNFITNDIFEDSYDKLIVATGAEAVLPNLQGVNLEGIFTLRTVEDADRIKAYIASENPKNAVVIGGGYIGLEMVEAFKHLGLNVSLIEKMPQIAPTLDEDMSRLVEEYLKQNGVLVKIGCEVECFEGNGKVNYVVTKDGEKLKADIVLLATGIKPNTKIAQDAGICVLPNGAIEVDEYMRTNIEDIFAAGDCASVYFKLNGKKMYVPLGSTANKMGRIAGENATGGMLKFNGILITSIFKIFDMTVAQTGYTEKLALEDNIDIEVGHISKHNITTAYPGSERMTIKAIVDKKTRKIIGAQIVGGKGVDKRIDVLATAIYANLTVDDLYQLDLAYAPPFSSAKDPVHYVGMVMSNFLDNRKVNITQEKLLQKIDSNQIIIVDVRTPEQYQKKHVKNAINIPLEQLHEKMEMLSREKEIVIYCNTGVSSNIAQNILQNNGYTNVLNLSGGIANITIKELIQEG